MGLMPTPHAERSDALDPRLCDPSLRRGKWLGQRAAPIAMERNHEVRVGGTRDQWIEDDQDQRRGADGQAWRDGQSWRRTEGLFKGFGALIVSSVDRRRHSVPVRAYAASCTTRGPGM
jgi:hypothetical protein